MKEIALIISVMTAQLSISQTGSTVSKDSIKCLTHEDIKALNDFRINDQIKDITIDSLYSYLSKYSATIIALEAEVDKRRADGLIADNIILDKNRSIENTRVELIESNKKLIRTRKVGIISSCISFIGGIILVASIK